MELDEEMKKRLLNIRDGRTIQNHPEIINDSQIPHGRVPFEY